MSAFDLDLTVASVDGNVVKNHMVDIAVGPNGKPSRSAISNRIRRICDDFGYELLEAKCNPVDDVFVIYPYFDHVVEMWVFDDAKHGLFGEPLVEGIDTMLDFIVEKSGSNKRRVSIAFSHKELSNYFAKLSLVGPCGGDGRLNGNNYVWHDRDMPGWLCPALYNYYDEAPSEIFIKIVDGSPGSCWQRPALFSSE